MSYINVQEIKDRYAPYNSLRTFEDGYADYMAGRNLLSLGGVAGQAYDRGAEAAMKVKQAERWIETNVGAD
jgi:hypothetical protein